MKQTLFEDECFICGKESIVTKYKVCFECMEQVSVEYGKHCERGRRITIEEVIEMMAIMNALLR